MAMGHGQSLLPARGQDGLHILRLLIDPLIPREAGPCSEPGHRLDQLIHLRAVQRLPVPDLNGLDPIGRADIPVLHGNLIGRVVNGEAQIIGVTADHQV